MGIALIWSGFRHILRGKSGALVNLSCRTGGMVATRIALREGQMPRLELARFFPSDYPQAQQFADVATNLRFRHTEIRILLAPGEYQFLQVELPQVAPEELNTAVGWQIKDMLRGRADESTLDILPLPDDSNGLRRPSGFVVAADNESLRAHMLRFRAFKSRVSVIDVPECAQRNIANLLEKAEQATAVLSISEEGALLTVSRAGILYFTRNFDISLPAVNRSHDTRHALFEKLTLEVQRSFDILERQIANLSLAALWLAPFLHCDELHSLLIENLYVPVKAIELSEILDLGDVSLPADPDLMATLFLPIGMALRGQEQP